MLFIFQFCCQFSYSQNNKIEEKNAFYVVCRSTKTKKHIIAKDFNVRDTLITHVGIGFIDNEGLSIFHVSNDKKNLRNSSLIKENLKQFLSDKQVSYYSIWQYKLDAKLVEEIKKSVNKIHANNVEFDYSFDLDNNKLYCSEFVYKVLRDFGKQKFKLSTKVKSLNSFYSMALKRDRLKYIPVDFFIKDSNFKKVYEKHL